MPGSAVDELRTKLTARSVTINGRRFYVAEGDLLLDDAQLIEYAVTHAAMADDPDRVPPNHAFVGDRRRLLATSRDGRILRWRDGMALSYVIVHATFPEEWQYETVRTNLREAARAWEDVCGVRIPHLEALDKATDEDPTRERPLFTVAVHELREGYLALAFFPHDPPDRRMLVIDPAYFSAGVRVNLTGVLRHELGHVLGFQHEHTRDHAPPDCRPHELANTTPVTEYDAQSVMHYLCGGHGSPDLELTVVDREGARAIYGPPLGQFELVT